MTENQSTDSEGDWGRTDLDPREQADAERFLDEPSASDDEPWSPPERMPRGPELIGVETDGGETLDQRLHQEQPEHEEDPDQPMAGGDDPDAIPADQDVLGGPASDRGATDSAYEGSSPEESAMRVVEDES